MAYLYIIMGVIYALLCSLLLYKTLRNKKIILNILICVIGFFVFCISEKQGNTVIISGISLVVMLFESISDIKDKKTYTYPIYIATAIAALIRVYQAYTISVTYTVNVIALIICAFIICRILEMFTKPFLGGGDIDIILLCTLANPLYGSMLILATVTRWIIYIGYICIHTKVCNKRNSDFNICVQSEDITQKISEKKKRILNITVPAVPFITLGYCLFLLF